MNLMVFEILLETMQNLSNFKKSKSQPHAAFLDINIFAHEGFTSGALIQMREILRRLLNFGIPLGVLSVAHAPLSPTWKPGKKVGKSVTLRNDIPVEEWLIEKSPKENLEAYVKAIRELLDGYKWRIIFMNTPAVFLEEINILALDEAVRSGTEVISVLPDVLYPLYATHPKKDVDRFYTLLKKTRVLAPSQFLIDRFFKDTGIRAEFFPNLFTVEEIVAKNGSYEYITLINHHPMKGRAIFDAIAQKMPTEKFLIIENWPDVPPYEPPSPNIKFSKFITDVRQLYGQTKVLLVPSLCEEGCPRVIVEALLNGIPVVAHNIGGISEAGLGVAKLIDPPPIKGVTIMPRVTPKNLGRQADKFVSVVRKITKSSSSFAAYSKQSRHTALAHCQRAEKIFADLAKSWFR